MRAAEEIEEKIHLLEGSREKEDAGDICTTKAMFDSAILALRWALGADDFDSQNIGQEGAK